MGKVRGADDGKENRVSCQPNHKIILPVYMSDNKRFSKINLDFHQHG